MKTPASRHRIIFIDDIWLVGYSLEYTEKFCAIWKFFGLKTKKTNGAK